MKRLAVLALILALAVGVYAQDTSSGLFKGLQVSYTAMSWIDLGTTYLAVSVNGGYTEKNPIARAYIRYPAATIALQLASDLAVHGLGGMVYRQSKPMGYAFVGALWIVRAYVLWHNFKQLKAGSR